MNTALMGWQENERKKTARAVLVSILLHLLLIVGIAVLIGLEPPAIPIPPDEDVMEITMIEPPKTEPKPAYLSTTSAQEAPKAPEKPAFESDKNTLAASAIPAEGTIPLPSQEGEESPATSFENREFTPGREPRPSAPAAEPSKAAPPVPLVQQAETSPQTPKEAVPKPEPTAPPDSEVALLQPVKPKAQPKPTPETPKPETRPATPSTPGYQPQTRITRLKGNISNRGRSSADAVSTPLGRYKKQISDAIGSRWYYYVNEAISLLNVGTLEVRFIVKSDGKVQKCQVLRNSSNESFASTSVRAVMDAEIPPIPPEILPMLKEGAIEVDFTFTILPN